jgi:hypothetical protein
MHAPVMGEAMWKMVFFLERQGVKVCAQTQGARAFARFQDAHHPGTRYTRVNFDAPGPQLVSHHSGCAMFFKSQLRMRVNIASQLRELAVIFQRI